MSDPEKKSKTISRGMLMPSKILDFLSQDNVDKKIEALLEQDAEKRTRRREEFNEAANSSLPKEEKERRMQDIVNEGLVGPDAVKKEQRMAALKLRDDYAEFRRYEKKAGSALLQGDMQKYERCVTKMADLADLVDMGIEFIENIPDFLSNFKVTKVRFLSDEEDPQTIASMVIRLKSIDNLI
jgi:hypothetical protein